MTQKRGQLLERIANLRNQPDAVEEAFRAYMSELRGLMVLLGVAGAGQGACEADVPKRGAAMQRASLCVRVCVAHAVCVCVCVSVCVAHAAPRHMQRNTPGLRDALHRASAQAQAPPLLPATFSQKMFSHLLMRRTQRTNR